MPDRTIEHIREKIAEANLPDDRKDKLFDLVDELKEELDKIADVLQTGLLKLIVAIGTIIGS